MKGARAEAARLEAVRLLCDTLDLDERSQRFQQALTHPSYANEQEATPDYERLEFLGDAVLGLCVSELLIERHGDSDEGELTLMRAALVNATALAARADALGVGPALRLGRGADASGERYRRNVLCDAIEAIVGAVYLDRGLDRARELCRHVIAPDLAALRSSGAPSRDAKSRLQELLQARGCETPRYRVAVVDGPPHARRFEVEVDVPLADGADVVTLRGVGRSKKEAEQKAADAALGAIEGVGERSEPAADG